MTQTTDTTERDAETVALFVEESLEGLQQIEQLLLAAESGSAPTDFIATMFRAVHTLKGTAGYLAFGNTQTLAHAAEDLLSKLRDKKLVAKAEHFTSLVSVGDKLRQMVENVRQSGEEGAVDVSELVEQLRSAAQQTTASAVAAEALATPVVPTPATAVVATAAPAAPVTTAAASQPTASVVQAPVQVASHEEAPQPEVAVASPKAETQDGTVRVSVGVLDRLMNLIGELVLSRNQLMQMDKGPANGASGMQSVLQRLNLVTSELQEQVMKTRMQPVARVFEKIPRMARDVARVTSKQVATQIDGNATEIDRALVEAIRDPVMHIVRNAIDHGIETPEERLANNKPATGTLSVRAAHKGGAVHIEIEDDGRGMDPAFMRAHAVRKGVLTQEEANKLSDRESVELVFRSGFSTASKVTDISGRGVGMDVVRTHVERAGGQAEIDSVFKKGTTIRLKMPLTLAIIPALLVRANGQRFAIPQVNLLELVYLTEEQKQAVVGTVRGAKTHRLRGEILPLLNLREVMGIAAEESSAHRDERDEKGTYIVVLAVGSGRYSLVVDGIDNTEEIVIKPLRGQLKRLTSFSGATVLGDGSVALILDAAGIATRAGIDLQTQRAEHGQVAVVDTTATERMMVLRVGGDTYCAVPLSLVSRLEEVSVSSIEQVGGREFLQYRGEILFIVRPEGLLQIPAAQNARAEQTLVVFDFGRRVAMAVDGIVDVTDLPMGEQATMADVPYTTGKAVVSGKTTLLLDAQQIITALAPDFVSTSAEPFKLAPEAT